jgi:hypothetical protein
MAKELPYFKFIASEWLTGSIIYESLESQGLFINICALYWQRGGVLTISEVEYRWKKKALIAKLCDRFISQCDGMIKIGFLDEQLTDRQYISIKNANNAKEGWEKRKSTKKCERNANRCNIEEEEEEEEEEEKNKNKKRKEEEKKGDKSPPIKFDFEKKLIEYGFEEKAVKQWLVVRKNKKATNSEIAFDSLIKKIEQRACEKNEILKIIIEKSWSGFEWEWIDNLSKNKNGRTEQAERKPIEHKKDYSGGFR